MTAFKILTSTTGKSVLTAGFVGFATFYNFSGILKRKSICMRDDNASELPITSGHHRSSSIVDHYAAVTIRSARAISAVGRIASLYKRLSMTEIPAAEVDIKWSDTHRRAAEILLQLCRDNGGVYIKLGQHCSALVHLLPVEYIDTLRPLQDECPQSSIEDIDSVIREDLGSSRAELFSKFDIVPIGSASLAQVHRARLINGTDVAVKIQHRHLLRDAPIDIETTERLVRFIHFLFPEFDFGWLSDEMKINLPRELDFREEAANSRRLATLLGPDSKTSVPAVHFATSRVLCMEYIDGARIDDLEYMQKNAIDKGAVLKDFSDAFYEMLFQHGFLHSDPHCGNVLVRARSVGNLRNGRNYDIVLLDHGLYRELDEQFRRDYSNLWLSIVRGREADIKKYSENLGGGDAYRLFTCILTSRSWEAVSTDLLSARTSSEKEHVKRNASRYMNGIIHLLSKIPRPLLLVLKTNDLMRHVESVLGGGEVETFDRLVYHCTEFNYKMDYGSSSSAFQRAEVLIVYYFQRFRLAVYRLAWRVWLRWQNLF
eukprot:Partr_v1_DN26272_c0_g1_i3_m48244 putative AarF domain containing kinase